MDSDSRAGSLKRHRGNSSPRHAALSLKYVSHSHVELEREQNETVRHERDSTEGLAIGDDDDTLVSAYGGEYFLQEEYLDKLSRQHQSTSTHRHSKAFGGDVSETAHGSDGESREKIELYVNPSVVQSLFSDAEELSPPTDSIRAAHRGENSAESDAAESSHLASSLWIAAQNAAMNIVVPVVDPLSALAQSAQKGSAELTKLRHTMAREAQNREVMETSKSSLSNLLKRDAIGREASSALLDEPGDCGNSSWSSRKGRADYFSTTTKEKEEEEEEGALRRQLRMKYEAMQRTASSSHGHSSEGSKQITETARKSGGQQQYDKMEYILAEQQRLAAISRTHTEEDRRATMDRKRKQLPIYQCKSELLRYIGENTVTVVIGETGSGKTTQLVQYLYEQGYAQHGKIIGCTQPRRLAAIGVSRRVSEEMHCALGTTVGYAIHLDDCTTDQTRIKFMTDGVLLREVVHDPDVNQYSIIIIDEAHERSIDTDVLMGILKLAISRRGDLKLIVTSATMDVQKFSNFFCNAPCYEIPGQTYNVEVRYSPTPVSDYVAEAVFHVCKLHLQAPLDASHNILVFMTGRDDVYGTCELVKRRLQDLNPAHLQTLLILPCLSEASTISVGPRGRGVASVIGVLDETPPGMRKCVVATNVAETSITIEGVYYVVDCGFMKTNVFRPKLGMNTLQRYPISQAQANQRRGRAGRTTEGLCFRLYTQHQYQNEMLPDSVPEIQRSSLDTVMLLLKKIGVKRLAEFDFMDPPSVASTRTSTWRLWMLGLVDSNGDITVDGRLALDFPMAPALSKLLIESTRHGCSLEVARIVALITADPKNLFELPKGKETVAQQHFGRFFNNESDHLTLLNVFTQFLVSGRSWQWAQDHYLHTPTLVRAFDVLEQLLDRLRRLRLPIVSCQQAHGGALDQVRYCIAKSFCLQAAQRSGTNWNEYRPLLNLGVRCMLHPSSAVCTRVEMPPYVVYNDLLLVDREYLVLVTAVEPEWLAEGSLYKMKKESKLWIPPTSSLAPTHAAVGHLNNQPASSSQPAPEPSCAARREESGRATAPTAGSGSVRTSKFESLLSRKRRENI